MRAIMLSSCLLLASAPAALAQGTPSTPMGLHWLPAPAVFPKGAQMVVISGDPGKPAPFTVELLFPGGYRIPPHFHPTDEVVEVKQGTFLFGMGDTFDASKTKTMKAGDKGSVKANMHHFAASKGHTIVAVTAMGPFAMTYVHPADDPRPQPVKP